MGQTDKNNVDISQTFDKAIRNFEPKKRDYFVNKVNFASFTNRTISIIWRHKFYDRDVTCSIVPYLSSKERLSCFGSERLVRIIGCGQYLYEYIEISDDNEIIRARPEIIGIENDKIVFQLPEKCYKVDIINNRSYICDGINVSLYQNSAMFNGELFKFSLDYIIVRVTFSKYQTIEWINPDLSVFVNIHEKDVSYYAGNCNILDYHEDKNEKSMIYRLELDNKNSPRFKKKKYRSTRYELVPSPDVIFIHPITKRKIILKVKDISGSGICVVERRDKAQLVPGIIIPNLEIHFALGFNIQCSAQVVYCNQSVDENSIKYQKCGIAFLDMDMNEQIKLLSVLQQAADENSYICNKVDMEELWNFFFTSGFIYPEKYELIQAKKEKLKDLYLKIYNQEPHIARHFIYQRDGVIMGHMGMIRFCYNSWMIHHHVASGDKAQWAGIKVLGQLIRYANNVHSIASAHMRYVFSYFRSEKKFPRRVLGGLASHLGDARKCSVDKFTYLAFDAGESATPDLPDDWKLVNPDREDFRELEFFYEGRSNGLFLDAFDLHWPGTRESDLIEEYARFGFRKEKKIKCLKENGKLKAFYIVNISDLGLNMSDLTNCLQVIVLDQEEIDEEKLILSCGKFKEYFELSSFPILLYPENIKIKQSIFKFEYTLWILDLKYIDEYIKFYERLLGRFMK
jgi:hypothetical protein